jgi:hypothetical protein
MLERWSNNRESQNQQLEIFQKHWFEHILTTIQQRKWCKQIKHLSWYGQKCCKARDYQPFLPDHLPKNCTAPPCGPLKIDQKCYNMLQPQATTPSSGPWVALCCIKVWTQWTIMNKVNKLECTGIQSCIRMYAGLLDRFASLSQSFANICKHFH